MVLCVLFFLQQSCDNSWINLFLKMNILLSVVVNSPLETTLPGAESSQSDSPIVKPVLIGLSVGLTMTMLIVGVLLLLKRKRQEINTFCATMLYFMYRYIRPETMYKLKK